MEENGQNQQVKNSTQKRILQLQTVQRFVANHNVVEVMNNMQATLRSYFKVGILNFLPISELLAVAPFPSL